MPGRFTSAEYFAAPVTLSLPSTRGVGLPMTLSFSLISSGGGSPSGTVRVASSIFTPGLPTGSFISGMVILRFKRDTGFLARAHGLESPCHDHSQTLFAAARTASNTLGYVPHRQRLPLQACFASASVGFLFFSSSETQLMIM